MENNNVRDWSEFLKELRSQSGWKKSTSKQGKRTKSKRIKLMFNNGK